MRDLLRDQALDQDTYVWGPTLSDWQPLGRTELAALLAGPPPRGPAPLPGSAGWTRADTTPVATGSAQADFVAAVRACFNKFVTWQGRSGRREFWYFFLFAIGIGIIASAIDAVFGSILKTSHFTLVSPLTSLALLLPNLAVSARRLHDTDRSAWWLLLVFLPLIGYIVLIVFWAQRGQNTDNRYGPPPAL
jgi:uncharacterized membrane protein YhaH (DUF805 family)